MTKRIIASLSFLVCLCFSIWANKEISIKFDDKKKVHTETLGSAYILTFEYLYYEGYNARVRVSLENTTQNPPLAILVFRRTMDEKSLKNAKPKIEFEKDYSGDKGKRKVFGCKVDYKDLDIVTFAETDTLFTLDVPLSTGRDLTLPLYIAKYKHSDLVKKKNNERDINYKILEDVIYDIHIEVEWWNEEDPTYVNTKKGVEEFISSLVDVEFCPNKNHVPSLKDMQRPYQEKKDSLINVVNTILKDNSEWMADHAPHIAYTKLLAELDKVDLDANVKDCGNHIIIPPPPYCNYCSLSAQELFHRFDELYQQLYAGKKTKTEAVKMAQAMYTCFQKHKYRKKDNTYGSKIARFYNKIVNY